MLCRKEAILSAVLISVFSRTPIVFAQTTLATVTGTVTDSSGAVVPNVTIIATHQATNTESTA